MMIFLELFTHMHAECIATSFMVLFYLNHKCFLAMLNSCPNEVASEFEERNAISTTCLSCSEKSIVANLSLIGCVMML